MCIVPEACRHDHLVRGFPVENTIEHTKPIFGGLNYNVLLYEKCRCSTIMAGTNRACSGRRRRRHRHIAEYTGVQRYIPKTDRHTTSNRDRRIVKFICIFMTRVCV